MEINTKILEVLLENYYIIKSENEELYYKVKDGLSTVYPFIKEKLGLKIIHNDKLIKLEKIPVIPNEYMGISTFTEKLDYVLFCLTLVYLEDKTTGDQFILSELIDFIQTTFLDIDSNDVTINFTLYSNRKSMVRVLTYIRAMSFIRIYDGNENAFADDVNAEALYQVTGISKYFTRNFSSSIKACTNYMDIIISEELGLSQDLGIRRRQRVYKRLFMEPAIYNTKLDGIEENDSDYEYIKNYKNIITQDIENYLNSQFALHKNGAYIMLDIQKSFRETHPSNKAISDIVLFVSNEIKKDILNKKLEPTKSDIITMSKNKLHTYILKTREKYQKGFTKECAEMIDKSYIDTVINYMEKYSMLRYNNLNLEYEILPLATRFTGKYPKEFEKMLEEENNE